MIWQYFLLYTFFFLHKTGYEFPFSFLQDISVLSLCGFFFCSVDLDLVLFLLPVDSQTTTSTHLAIPPQAHHFTFSIDLRSIKDIHSTSTLMVFLRYPTTSISVNILILAVYCNNILVPSILALCYFMYTANLLCYMYFYL